MNPDRWEEVQDAYFEALERSGDARATYLTDLEGRDAALAAEVRSLLGADDRPDPLLAASLEDLVWMVDDDVIPI